MRQINCLRTADGKIAIDPVTNEARRIDFAVIENGKIKQLVETTSLTANKLLQTAKENGIRAAGGTFIRDKQTRKLIDVSNVQTEVIEENKNYGKRFCYRSSKLAYSS